MTLLELEPRWLTPNVFIFRCPHCRELWLVCKNVPMTQQEQFDLLEQRLGADWNETVVPARAEYAWKFQSDAHFSVLTVEPSIDASASGHWHGHITSGAIR